MKRNGQLDRNLTRRQLLLGCAAFGTLGLAGCAGTRAELRDDPSGIVALDALRGNGYMGRWFSLDIDGRTCKATTAPGAFLELEVEGTGSLEVRFDSLVEDTPLYWAYEIDGGEPERLKTGTRSIALPDSSAHVVRITADGTLETSGRWENERGFALRGIDAGSGSCAPHALEGEVIAFYGDSITEGDCVFGPGSLPERDSAVHGYATLCARELGCLPYCSGYGGSGITEKGTFAPALEAVAHYSHGRLAPEFDADLVVVEHGTNDKRCTEREFERGYSELLEKLAELHPEAQAFCMVPLTQLHAPQIRACAKSAGAQVVETQGWAIDLVADDTHPSVEGAQAMARKLAEVLRPFLA